MNLYEYLFKIIVIGDSGVGKSNIINRFVENKFNEEFISNIGVDLVSKIVYIQGREIKLQILDTAGNQIFRVSNTIKKFGVSNIIIIVYDVTDQNSFNNIPMWLIEVEKFAPNNNAIKIIIGNKCDLITQRVVGQTFAKEFADSLNLKLFETSAKQSINIEDTFISVTEQCLKLKDLQNSKSNTTTLISNQPQKSNCIIN
ncbi:hypothetical protein ACTFIZ_009941 [Dictyostelium cf. discoideum]